MMDDAADIGEKTHVEHAIGFVENQDLDALQIGMSLIQEIQQAAGRRHQNVDAIAEDTDLRALSHATEDRCVTQPGFPTVRLKTVGDLRRELAGRRDDQGAGSGSRREG